jgi:hypothetical protein
VNREELVAMLRHNAEWADLGGMNLRTFVDNRQAILAALNALLVRPQSRRQFRLLAVHVQETGELLAEVFDTTHGPVVVCRSGSTYTGAEGTEFVRQDRGGANRVVAPLDNDPDQRFLLVASRGQCVFMNRDLRRWIVDQRWSGKRHTVSLAQ